MKKGNLGYLIFGIAILLGSALLVARDRPATQSSALTAAQTGTTSNRSAAQTNDETDRQSEEDDSKSQDESSDDKSADDSPPEFHGYACTQDCSGHEAGYNWAEEHDIDDPHTCYSGPRLSNPAYLSFSEGCEAYVDETTGDEPLDPSERYQ